jgi:hypothetical protein
MAFDELQRRRLEKVLDAHIEKRRPPPHIRPQLDLGYLLTKDSVELIEIRPQWDNPKVITKRPYARARYFKSRDLWRVYWMRADLKWHLYEPDLEAKTIERFLAIVDKDEYCCFKG